MRGRGIGEGYIVREIQGVGSEEVCLQKRGVRGRLPEILRRETLERFVQGGKRERSQENIKLPKLWRIGYVTYYGRKREGN